MRRAIIFDFGNVITRTVDYGPRHAWDDRLGLPQGSVERAVHNQTTWIQAQLGQISVADYWAAVRDKLGISKEDAEQLAADFYKGDQLNTDLIAYIRELRTDGYPIALLSNFSLELETLLRQAEITDLFDPLVISAHIGVMKPDAATYHAVLSRLGLAAEETIFIDDRLENIQAARALGIYGIHYKTDTNLRTTINDLLHA